MKEGQIRIPSGCAISGIFNKAGKRMSGENIIKSIAIMHDRSNGLGGEFAAYGIYPEYKDYYAFHMFYDNYSAKKECEEFLERHFEIITLSKIPVKKIKEITDEPLIWRYFGSPLATKLAETQLEEREFVARCVFRVNTGIDGAYIFSSGKNMGGGGVKRSAFQKMSGGFTVWLNTKDIVLPPMGVIQLIRRAGGAALTPLLFWTTACCIMVRYHLTMPTGGLLKCTAISVRLKQIPKLLLIS